MTNVLCLLLLVVLTASSVGAWSGAGSRLLVARSRSVSGSLQQRQQMKMAVENDAFRKANRDMRKAGADERMVELRMPMGLILDEDKDGNVFVKEIEKDGRADRTGMIFVGDRVAMVSATFGDDMWSCRGVGLTRVMSTIKVRNSKPVRMVLEAATQAEEKKRRLIAFAEMSEEQKVLKKKKDDELLAAMLLDDKSLLNKRKGFLGLW